LGVCCNPSFSKKDLELLLLFVFLRAEEDWAVGLSPALCMVHVRVLLFVAVSTSLVSCSIIILVNMFLELGPNNRSNPKVRSRERNRNSCNVSSSPGDIPKEVHAFRY